MNKRQQDALKDVGGFVAGTLSGPRRKAGAVAGRDLITLDLDNLPPGSTEEVARRVEGLGCGYCIYSTRKHQPARPRLRVLIPTDRTMSAEEYEPCARRIAAYIGLEWADPTTFEVNRLMYWPSCCSDGVFAYYVGDKPFVTVDGLLATYPDWHDTTGWPTVPGAPSPGRLAAKQGDPTEKRGVVGAFCKTYDVPSAMEKFLPGVYAPCDTGGDRYTFTSGSTTGGAVLYDDGKFLYSHHATDPCSGKLVNAFDLVRIHKFGEMDDDAQPGTPTIRLPSYTAMEQFAAGDESVAHLLAAERWQRAQAAFGVAATDEEDDSWQEQLELDAKGNPQKTLRNLTLMLEHDPGLCGRLRLNLFSGRLDVTGTLPWQRPNPSAGWSDDDVAQLRIYLEAFFGKLSKNDLLDAVSASAGNQAYHPIRDYLNALIWDGIPRLDTLFVDYLGVENTPYSRAVTRKSLTAAVARVMTPGCKYDTMVVLVGGQGRFKSTILSKLGGKWFSDSLRSFGDKDSMETIQGTWIDEIPEMQAMSRSDVDAVKAFLTKTSDYYRAAYGRYTADRPRQCVLFGTTNSRECLTDPTGGRRFWVLDIDRQQRTKDVWADLDRERDQIWAEAVFRWKEGEPLYLNAEIEAIAREVQEDHRQRHPWEGLIAEFLERPIPQDWAGWAMEQRQVFWSGGARYEGELVPRARVCAVEIWCEALNKQRGDLSQRTSREINSLLERMPGWESAGCSRAGKPYGFQRSFRKRGST